MPNVGMRPLSFQLLVQFVWPPIKSQQTWESNSLCGPLTMGWFSLVVTKSSLPSPLTMGCHIKAFSETPSKVRLTANAQEQTQLSESLVAEPFGQPTDLHHTCSAALQHQSPDLQSPCCIYFVHFLAALQHTCPVLQDSAHENLIVFGCPAA